MINQSDDTEFKCPPILFNIFNRPDLAKRVFECIRNAKPRKLFIAADGPRVEHPNDLMLCHETRAIIDQIDWNCELHTLFRDNNLGLKKAFQSAITWFFEYVEEGIIMEDDCIPHPTFFRYCQELLEYFREENRVMMIGGNSVQLGIRRTSESYYFSQFSHIGGWATWKRAWKHNDADLKTWPDTKRSKWIKSILNSREGVTQITQKLDSIYRGDLSSWGYVWQYSCWQHNGLCVVPNCNLVTEVGFDERATHTKQPGLFSFLKVEAMVFPLRHPSRIVRNRKADRFIINHLVLHYPLISNVGWFRFLYISFRKKIPAQLRWRLDKILNNSGDRI